MPDQPGSFSRSSRRDCLESPALAQDSLVNLTSGKPVSGSQARIFGRLDESVRRGGVYREVRQRRVVCFRREPGHGFVRSVGNNKGDDGRREGIALKLRPVDVPQIIVRGVNVVVWPVGESDRGRADRGLIKRHMVGTVVKGNDRGVIAVPRPQGRVNGLGESVAPTGLRAGQLSRVSLHHVPNDALGQSCQEMRARERDPGYVLDSQHILALVGSDHVLIDVRQDFLPLLGMVRKILPLAADFRHPPESEVAARAGELAVADQFGEAASYLECIGAA